MLFKDHDIESRSKLGVEEVILDELRKSKFKVEIGPSLEELPRSVGRLGGVNQFPLTTYLFIISLLKREAVVYI